MDRRTFVASTIGAAVPLVWPNRERPLPAARDRLETIGLQLYTLRDAMANSVERTLHEVARIGYREVEFAGYFGRPPRAIRQLLDRNGLASPSAHIDLGKFSAGWYSTLNAASEMGHKWLVVPSLPSENRDSLASLKRTAELFNRAADDAKTFNIRVAYHNHDTDFREVEGRRPFDVLLEETDPKLIDFEMDLYWITMMGADPLSYFERWPGRFPLVHVKDGKPAPTWQMTDVGKGSIDFARIFAKREQAGIKHYFVEHDNPQDPMATVASSCKYLRSLEF